ncbi:hypothetical protein PG993_011442 [Apiospora rasikravindrae]|uniref:Nephrocystin 3-like N-terminal domain-containing protein n=1 Tax=Apiospora rasikravindrae TaxID=990691 RepID=A0ABR1SEL8_9PEZI
MEAMAALSVAAAAVQFFGVALRTIALFRQSRDNPASANNYARGLDDSVQELQSMQAQLAAAAAQSKQQPSTHRIAEWTAKCRLESEELLKLLEKVRGAGKSPSRTISLFRAMKDRRRIERLEKSLLSKKEVLQDILRHDTWRLTNEQNSRLHETLHKLESISLINENATIEMSANVTKRLSDTELTMTRKMTQAEVSASCRHEEVMMEAKKRQEEAHANRLLHTLFFPEILERQYHIQSAAPGTLEWIFETGAKHHTSDQKDVSEHRPAMADRPWDNLAMWLLHGNGVYWINGKPGSGKSTLMAHIVEDTRTRDALDVWSGDQHTSMLSFFFWRPGTPLQRSIVGLLRSLLYQLCDQRQDRIKSLMGWLRIKPSMIHTWTERQLKRAVHEVIDKTTEDWFCIFIDGLDEFTGDYAELIDLIFELQAHARVKFCVSSRPEVQLIKRLSSCKTLCLQDLNLPDITHYAWTKLSGAQFDQKPCYYKHLHTTIARMSEGVFLWAALVTKSLVRGVESGDDEEVLLKRIGTIPQDLNDLFKSMLERVDKVHHDSLAFYLAVLKAVNEAFGSENCGKIVHIALLASVRTPRALYSSKAFESACEAIESQVLAQSAGLLEIHESTNVFSDGDFFHQDGWDPEEVWLRVEDPVQYTRARQTGAVAYPKALTYERRHVTWVHRSAYDFVCDPENVKDMRFLRTPSGEVLRELSSGYLGLIRSAPSTTITTSNNQRITITELRIHWLLLAFHLFWNPYTPVTRDSMDNLRLATTEMDSRELVSEDWFNHKLDNVPFVWTFWAEAAATGNWEYIVEKLDKLPLALYGLVLYHSFLKPGDDISESNCRNLQHHLVKVLQSLYRGDQVCLLWTFHEKLSRSISYDDAFSARSESTSPLLIGKYLAVYIALTVVEYGNAFHPQMMGCWREVLDNSRLYIEFARASPRLFLQALASNLCTGRSDVVSISSFRIICFQHPTTDTAPEAEQFIYFEICPVATDFMSQLLRRDPDGDPPRTQIFKLCATLDELETCHHMIIDGFRGSERDLDATNQSFVLECLQTHLWSLLKSIWQERRSPVRGS